MLHNDFEKKPFLLAFDWFKDLLTVEISLDENVCDC